MAARRTKAEGGGRGGPAPSAGLDGAREVGVGSEGTARRARAAAAAPPPRRPAGADPAEGPGSGGEATKAEPPGRNPTADPRGAAPAPRRPAEDGPALAARRRRGRTADRAGRAAEGAVARHYARTGLAVVEARWRGLAGEIDLVLRDGEGTEAGLVFVEVKAARGHAEAARALTPRQVARLLEAGAEYLGTQPMGQLTEARFDVALVDRSGRVEIIENALGQ